MPTVIEISRTYCFYYSIQLVLFRAIPAIDCQHEHTEYLCFLASLIKDQNRFSYKDMLMAISFYFSPSFINLHSSIDSSF